MGGDHIADTPALVLHSLPDLFEQLFLNFRRRKLLRDGNEIFNSKKSHGVLVV